MKSTRPRGGCISSFEPGHALSYPEHLSCLEPKGMAGWEDVTARPAASVMLSWTRSCSRAPAITAQHSRPTVREVLEPSTLFKWLWHACVRQVRLLCLANQESEHASLASWGLRQPDPDRGRHVFHVSKSMHGGRIHISMMSLRDSGCNGKLPQIWFRCLHLRHLLTLGESLSGTCQNMAPRF